MDRGPIDLSPLDPTRDAQRYERLVQRIVGRAAAELDRRTRLNASVVTILADWARPVLGAAAAITVLATASVGALDPLETGNGPAQIGTVVDALELPAPLAGWVAADGPPSISAVIAAAEGGQLP